MNPQSLPVVFSSHLISTDQIISSLGVNHAKVVKQICHTFGTQRLCHEIAEIFLCGHRAAGTHPQLVWPGAKEVSTVSAEFSRTRVAVLAASADGRITEKM